MVIYRLDRDYDLSKEDDLTLANTMKDLCSSYMEARYELSSATVDVWEDIVTVAEEIVRRKGGNTE